MRQHRHRLTETITLRGGAAHQRKGPAADPIEEVQLRRLAGAVLSKSPADLAALAESNPMIVWEWVEAFRRQKVEAEAEMRYWSAAMAALTTATPEAVKTAAE
jgi:PAS domain-containing protein